MCMRVSEKTPAARTHTHAHARTRTPSRTIPYAHNNLGNYKETSFKHRHTQKQLNSRQVHAQMRQMRHTCERFDLRVSLSMHVLLPGIQIFIPGQPTEIVLV